MGAGRSAALILLFWGIGALIGPTVLPYQPLAAEHQRQLASARRIAIFWGADKLGRDIFARVDRWRTDHAARRVDRGAGRCADRHYVGALAGYTGGLWDEALMRLTDVFLAFPTVILAMAVAAALGPSVINAVVTIAIVGWPNYARVTRGLVLRVKTSEYVEAARAIGSPHWRILMRTILPNCSVR